jgi:hypothetical protein
MSKNITFKKQHEKLGPLVVNIIGDNTSENSGAIKPDFLKKYGKLETQQFLFQLYQSYMRDEKLLDIIGEYLVLSTKKSNEQIVKEINTKYNALYKSKNKDDYYFSNGDGVYLDIARESKPDDALFTANIIIKQNKKYGTYAYVDSNETIESARRQGLQKLGFATLEKYLESHDVHRIVLEAQDLDGNEFNLEETYRKLGFVKQENGDMVKDLGRDEFSM